MGVQRNCSLLLNCDKLKDRMDIRADDLGTWHHNGVISTYLEVISGATGEIVDIRKKNKNFMPDEHARYRHYLMRRIYHKNGTAPDFKRMLVEIEGMLNICSSVVYFVLYLSKEEILLSCLLFMHVLKTTLITEICLGSVYKSRS